MPSIEDVAKLAGVSTATVSAVVNDRDIVKPRTKKRVLEAMRELNYEPNFYAQTLARGRSKTIGIIISDILNPFFAEIAQIVQENALRRGYQVLISVTDFSIERLHNALRHMIGMRIDGILIMTSEMDDVALKMVQERNLPAVFEDVGTVNATTSNLCIDYSGGIYRAVRCLVELGHRKIMYVQSPPASLQVDQVLSHRLRAKAFEDAIARFPGVIGHKFDGSGRIPFQAGIDNARQILQEFDVTGIVANADPHAVGMLRGFQRCGKVIPDDVSIIGFDNSIVCEYTDPPLASVNISRKEIAGSAVESLLCMIEQNRPGVEIYIPTELVMRESVGRPRNP
jgi:LacI family transcriptional regulator